MSTTAPCDGAGAALEALAHCAVAGDLHQCVRLEEVQRLDHLVAQARSQAQPSTRASYDVAIQCLNLVHFTLPDFDDGTSPQSLAWGFGLAVAEAAALGLAALAAGLEAANALASHVNRYHSILWCILSEVPPQCCDNLPPGYLQNCADLAFYVPPAPCELEAFVGSCFTLRGTGDPAMLGTLMVLAVNAEVSPGDSPLAAALVALPPEGRERVQEKLDSWRGSLRYSKLGPWASLVDKPLAAPDLGTEPAAPEPPVPPPAPQAAPPPEGHSSILRNALQEAVRDAPLEFRCVLDGQLLMDPVRSPQGYVFERAGLSHALQQSGGLCPVTKVPLALEACPRDAELRRRIARWVRERGPRRRAGE